MMECTEDSKRGRYDIQKYFPIVPRRIYICIYIYIYAKTEIKRNFIFICKYKMFQYCNLIIKYLYIYKKVKAGRIQHVNNPLKNTLIYYTIQN